MGSTWNLLCVSPGLTGLGANRTCPYWCPTSMWWGAPEHGGSPAPLVVKLCSLLAVLQSQLRYLSCELSPSRRRGQDQGHGCSLAGAGSFNSQRFPSALNTL